MQKQKNIRSKLLEHIALGVIVLLMVFTCLSLSRCEIFWVPALTDALEEMVEDVEEYVEDKIEDYKEEHGL
jgi:hypothetical protein